MRHFANLPEPELARLFHLRPTPFGRDSDPAVLAVALGATLYMPATRPTLRHDLAREAGRGVVSVVVCLEDAVADHAVEGAEANLVTELRAYADSRGGAAAGGEAQAPLVFVRVREREQIRRIVDGLGEHAWILSGFVLPKFDDVNGPAYLEAVASASESTPRRLLAMPVIESPEVIHRETRQETLLGIQLLLSKYRESVLAVRIGATDLCSAFGIRRDRDLTIYDVRLVADVITDVINVLGRADGTGFPVVGPVWEYFSDHERMLKPQLRQGPFDVADAHSVRRELISLDLDGLIREILLDKANGLIGKTVIHPSHVAAVHALYVVTHEEFCDATDILDADMAGGGVKASGYRNKMNEAKPHRAWAERTLRRAGVFGVAAQDVSVVDVLVASVTA